MRWNCPHCEEQVTAEIDFISMKEAYVQCEPCGGLSILHRGAMITQTITKTVLVTPPKAPIQEPTPEIEMTAALIAPEVILEAAPEPETASAVPPPFRAPQPQITSSFPKPPAFLLRTSNEAPKPLETVETFVEPPRTARKSMFANIGVWFAVMTATASGVYLYTQVKAAQIGGVKQIFAAVTRAAN